jgi:hypothetical protein
MWIRDEGDLTVPARTLPQREVRDGRHWTPPSFCRGEDNLLGLALPL